MASQSECVYVASRRGYKGPRRGTTHNPNKRHASSSPDASDVTSAGGPDSCPMLLGATAPAMTSAAFTPSAGLGSDPNSPFLSAAASMNHLQLYRTTPFGTPISAVQHHAPIVPVTTIADKCFDSFYYHYYASHPFVLPREYFVRHLRETGQKLEHLQAAMRYVGSLFMDVGPARASYLDEALRLCYSPSTPKDGFLVQALLLLIVALDGSCQQDKARDLLTDCERIAVEIGMNTRQFATMHGRGNPILEESWRRTWWDLYVIDGMVAGVHRVTNFLLFDLTADVALPCEESEFLLGVSNYTCTYTETHDNFLSLSQLRKRERRTDSLSRLYRSPCTWKTLTISSSRARTARSPRSRTVWPRSGTSGASCAAGPSCSRRTRTSQRWRLTLPTGGCTSLRGRGTP